MVDRVIDSVHFVQSHNNYLMQLADVMCYLIRKGKESDKKLFAEWHEQNEKEKINYQEWKKASGHRGHKYFADAYGKINRHKPWLFSKDFP